MSEFRRRIIGHYFFVNIESTSIIRPRGIFKELVLEGGSDDVSVLVGNTAEFVAPTKISAIFYNDNKTTTINFGGFFPRVVSSNSSCVSVESFNNNLINGAITLTCKTPGSSIISIYNGDALVKQWNITVTNENNIEDVTDSVVYSTSDENIAIMI